MSNATVAVVIPTYNRAALLKEAIESVIAQTYDNLKIIIFDNASFDGTAELLENINDDRLIVIRHEKNIGMQLNWKAALSFPTEKYIAFLEDDNVYLPHHIERAVNNLEKNIDCAFYSCGTQTFGNASPRVISPFWLTNISEVKIENSDDKIFQWLKGCPIASSSMVIRGVAVPSIDLWGGNNWPMSMDYLWWGQLALAGKYIFNPEIGVKYRWHETNISHQWYKKTSKVACDLRYTIRALANACIKKELIDIDQFINELVNWPAGIASTVVIAISSPDSHPILRAAALDIFRRHPSISTREASGHTRLAGIIGSWYLGYGDRISCLLAGWPSKS